MANDIIFGNNTDTYEVLKRAGELPAVTSADNGDVLTVIDGAWAKAEPSGDTGGGVFIAHRIQSSHNLDKSPEEIATAWKEGKAIYLTNPNGSDATPATITLEEDEEYFTLRIEIFHVTDDAGHVEFVRYAAYDSTEWDSSSYVVFEGTIPPME